MTARTPGSATSSGPPTSAGPALALLELNSIARGMVVADAMVKKAAVRLDQAQAVTPGKYVVVISGGEEEVSESLEAGIGLCRGTLIDKLYLAKADPQLVPAVRGEAQTSDVRAVGVVETFTVAATVLAADRAAKAAEVRLMRMRLARGLGGKAYFVLTGDLHQVEAAIAAAHSVVDGGMVITTEVIARPHPDFVRAL